MPVTGKVNDGEVDITEVEPKRKLKKTVTNFPT
jgi:hypothetical protein